MIEHSPKSQHANRVDEFRRLHQSGSPLLLPNAWDLASARMLIASGYQAIGTTSRGVAYAAGKPDAAGKTRDETLILAQDLAGLDCLITVDVEAGFTNDQADVVDLARELASIGVVGINIEDGSPAGGLRPTMETVGKIRAIKNAVPDLFINARTDSYWVTDGAGDLGETLARAQAYAEAGADGIFVPSLGNLDAITQVTSTITAPLNILHQAGGPNVETLAAAGVARISSGSFLFRTAMAAIATTMAAIKRGDQNYPWSTATDQELGNSGPSGSRNNPT